MKKTMMMMIEETNRMNLYPEILILADGHGDILEILTLTFFLKSVSELTVEPVLVFLRSTFSWTFIPTDKLHYCLFSGTIAHILVSLSLGRPRFGLTKLLHILAIVAVEYGRPVSDSWPHSAVQDDLIEAFV